MQNGRGRGRGMPVPAWMSGQQQQQFLGRARPQLGAPQYGGYGASPMAPSASDWSEHVSPDGRKYFYNSKTNQSSWERPKALGGGGGGEESESRNSAWVKYMSPDGRPYYHNAQLGQTSWTLPTSEQGETKEVQDPSSSPAKAKGQDGKSPGKVDGEKEKTKVEQVQRDAFGVPIRVVPAAAAAPVEGANVDGKQQSAGLAQGAQPQPVVDQKGFQYATKAEAKAAFKDLLREKGVKSRWTWDEALSATAGDSRYGALRTLPERKNCFNEYLSERRELDMEEEEKEREKIREAFLEMLGSSSEIDLDSSFSKAKSLFELDRRWQDVRSWKTKELYFGDYLKQLKKKERDAKHSERKAKMETFKKLLEQTEWVNVDSQCRTVLEKLRDEPASKLLDDIDKLAVFKEYHSDLVQREEMVQAEAQRKRKRQERINRDVFCKLLEEAKENGEIDINTSWADFFPSIEKSKEKSAAYEAVKSNRSGSRPKELFEDVIDALQEDLAPRFSRLKDILSEESESFALSTSTSKESFFEFLQPLQEYRVLDNSSKMYLYNACVEWAKAKESREARKRRHLLDDFKDMLRGSRELRERLPWEEVKGKFDEKEFQSIREEEKKTVYELLLQKKNSTDRDDEKEEDAEHRSRHGRRRRRKHRRSRSRSPKSDERPLKRR